MPAWGTRRGGCVAGRRARGRRLWLHGGEPSRGPGGTGEALLSSRWLQSCPRLKGRVRVRAALTCSGGVGVLRAGDISGPGPAGPTVLCPARLWPPDTLPQSCGRLAGGEGGWRGSRAAPEGPLPTASADEDADPRMACLGFPSC